MRRYEVTRSRWISKNTNDGLLHGYGENYADIVYADYYGVSESGNVTFYTKTLRPTASYASGEWKSIKEIDESTANRDN